MKRRLLTFLVFVALSSLAVFIILYSIDPLIHVIGDPIPTSGIYREDTEIHEPVYCINPGQILEIVYTLGGDGALKQVRYNHMCVPNGSQSVKPGSSAWYALRDRLGKIFTEYGGVVPTQMSAVEFGEGYEVEILSRPLKCIYDVIRGVRIYTASKPAS